MPDPDPNFCAFCGTGLYEQRGGTPSFVGNKMLISIKTALDSNGSPNDRLHIDSNVEGYWIGFCDQCDSSHGINNQNSISDITSQMQFQYLIEATR